MNCQLKRFEELTTNELYQILKVRAEIFVVEQDCVYLDLDSKDQVSYHLFFEDEGEIASYLRILPPNISYLEASIGRVVTNPKYRNQGLSRQLIKKAIAFMENTLEEQAIRISGQAYLLEFYKSLGFKPVSEVYLEDNIEHYEMLYTKAGSEKQILN